MWPLRIASARAAPECLAGRQLLACLRIYLAEHDGIIGIADHVAMAILEVERRVYALLLQPDGVAPRAARVLGLDEEVSAVANVGRNHVVGAVMVAQRRRIDAQPRRRALERQLLVGGQNVAQQFPVDHVATVEDGHAGEVFKARVDEVVVLAHADGRRVRVIAADDRVAVGLRLGAGGRAERQKGQC